MAPAQGLVLIFLSWLTYLFLIKGLRRTQSAVRYERQARGIALTRIFGPEKEKVPRLCGYHTGALLRPGQMAVLDSDNCELCNAPAHARR